MRYSFTFKGVSSESFPGLMVCELPSIRKPSKRYNKITIDGRDGDIIEALGYESYDKPVQIGLTSGYNIDDIIEWLDGAGDLSFSNEPDRIYTAEVLDEIDFERLVMFRKATVTFHVQPFKIKTHSQTLLKTSTGSLSDSLTVTNEGNTEAFPDIRITCAGELSLTINGTYTCTINTSSSTTYTLFCEKGEIRAGAMDEAGAFYTSKMSGDFPVLQKGENTIAYSVAVTGTQTGLTNMRIRHQSRWI